MSICFKDFVFIDIDGKSFKPWDIFGTFGKLEG